MSKTQFGLPALLLLAVGKVACLAASAEAYLPRPTTLAPQAPVTSEATQSLPIWNDGLFQILMVILMLAQDVVKNSVLALSLARKRHSSLLVGTTG